MRELEDGEIVPADAMLMSIYGLDVTGYKHADTARNKVAVHIFRIREKIKQHAINWELASATGRGYWLEDLAT